VSGALVLDSEGLAKALREDAPTLRSRTGMRVPSTIHSRSTASWEVRGGSSASSGAICRMVRFVR
jgi:hypothetical protein